MSKNKSIKTDETSTPADTGAGIGAEVAAFVKGIYSDLAPAPGEDTGGSTITSAVLNNTERAYAEQIAAMLGERGSLSQVMRAGLRRLIVEGQSAGVFDESSKA